ncbi:MULTISPECIES: sensor domain-containing diguanylate cyclase [Uliginosibacterium]|uniref:Diguanylate cyclase n=1 Tax=Uliginosibacterium aquaticum TaxID=2731212 RepID=A0ABX2IFF9_9RHOO|nr:MULTISPECIES: sensor domain-containing diguanylate cyclase [Uliginosibacterium]MDO6384843.1 diguanylate cyclase [Uliginosibacterium sp. 31-12]NSL55445.1 diguanylate cyclase [Uliginosibacterium aquaticum]PLK48527.1 sensor domain-containing diguanylate cyclase [Uliginosibacterium sp. TH139]
MKLTARLSLRQWLTLPYLALVLGVAILIGALSYRTGSQAVDTVAQHLLQETVARIGQAVDRHVFGSAAVLEAAFPNGMAAPPRLDKDLPALRTRFWIATSLHIDPNNYVYYGNQQGQFFGLWRFNQEDAELRVKLQAERPREISRFTGINGQPGSPVVEQKMFEPRQRPWYKAGEGSPSHTWTSIYIDFRNSELVATRARRVLDNNGQLQGVVATDLSLKRLNDFVRKLTISRNAVAFIIEPDGKLIASSRSPNVARQPDGSNARISAAESHDALQRAAYAQVQALIAAGTVSVGAVTQRFTGPEGGAVELAFDRVRDEAGLDWIIAVAVPRSDFMQGVTANVKRSALIGLLGALVAVVLGLSIVGWIGGDLKRLTEAAQAAGEGHLEAPLDIHRNDEIGVLANTFREMQHALRTDGMTGLANRDEMLRAISRRIEFEHRTGNPLPFAVLFVDLNNFKQINDHFGHDAGDRVLVEFATRLRNSLHATDRVARYAGDEFVILVQSTVLRQELERLRTHIEELMRAPLESIDLASLPGGTAGGAAVGLACYPEHGQSADELIAHCDHDMYQRKRASRLGRS